jgi:hypothetical protein
MRKWGFILKERQGRKAPFFKEDIEGDYVIPDKQDEQNTLSKIGLSLEDINEKAKRNMWPGEY